MTLSATFRYSFITEIGLFNNIVQISHLSNLKVTKTRVLFSKWAIYMMALFLRLRNLHGRGVRKMIRARWSGRLSESSIFWTPQGGCTYEFTVIVRDAQKIDKLRRNKVPAQRGRGGHKVPTLTEEILAFANYQEKSRFSLSMDPCRSIMLQGRICTPRVWGQHK